jgi:hypothetical protein
MAWGPANYAAKRLAGDGAVGKVSSRSLDAAKLSLKAGQAIQLSR